MRHPFSIRHALPSRRQLKTAFLLAAFCLALSSPAYAQKTISVDFNSTGQVTESNGTVANTAPSTLTADQKKAVIDKIQAEYDAALGAGKVTVKEGTGGDYSMVVSGGDPPNPGAKYGNAGQPGKPGVVYEKEFTGAGVSGDELVNCIEETTAHEAGHKLGLSHNKNDPSDKMTEGSLKSLDQRKADNRSFNPGDKDKLSHTVTLARAENTNSFPPLGLGVLVGMSALPGPNEPDGAYLNANSMFDGPADTEYGYFSSDHEFVFQGNVSKGPGILTFPYTAGVDLAVKQGTIIFSLSNGMAEYILSNPNPDMPGSFLTADVFFGTAPNAHLTLTVTDVPTTGGFFSSLCTPGLVAQDNVIPVQNSAVMLCESGRGWSDTKFFGPYPPFYDQGQDVLSGDYAVNLRWMKDGVVSSGTGWFTNGMDAGRLVPSYSTGSLWVPTDGPHFIGDRLDMVSSTIHHPDGLDAVISTTLDPDGTVHINYSITNNSPAVLQSVTFVVYDNYHPNGSLNPNQNKGSLTVSPDGWLSFVGMPDPTFVANESLWFDRTLSGIDSGFASPSDTIGRVEMHTPNGLTSFGPGDSAGALFTDLGDLLPGGTFSINVTQQRIP